MISVIGRVDSLTMSAAAYAICHTRLVGREGEAPRISHHTSAIQAVGAGSGVEEERLAGDSVRKE